MGFQARGYFFNDRLQYRGGIFAGERDANGRNAPRARHCTCNTTSSSPEKEYAYAGTALGKRKILAIDVGGDKQGSYRAYSANIASDTPVRGGDEVGFNFQCCTSTAGRSSLAIPDQNNFLAEGAYYVHKAKVQPFAKFETQDFVAAVNGTKDINRCGAGANYYIRGQNLKWTVQYTRALPQNGSHHPAQQRIHHAVAGVLLLSYVAQAIAPSVPHRQLLQYQRGVDAGQIGDRSSCRQSWADVLTSKVDLVTYSYDATADVPRQIPDVVVMPTNTEEIQQHRQPGSQHAASRSIRAARAPTSAAAPFPCERGIVLSFQRMNRILEVDAENLTATVQPGVVIQELNNAVAPHGLIYPPDPGTVNTATMGGSVAENSGGLRGLKYGVTKHYVMGMEVVLANGDKVRFGGKTVKNVTAYDFASLFVGSEGTLGIITEITVKLIPAPQVPPHHAGHLPDHRGCGQHRRRHHPGAGDSRPRWKSWTT